MPTIDAAAQADAQVTVAIVLAGFAFAGFVLLMDNLRDSRSSESRTLYFQSMFLLAATFSIGTLTSFFYALSRGLAPWDAYRGLIFGHALFTLEILALITSVGWLLGIYTPHYFRRRAWWMMTVIGCYSFVRFTAEVVRHSRQSIEFGSQEISVIAVAAIIAVVPFAWMAGRWAKNGGRTGAKKRQGPVSIDETRINRTTDVMRYVFGLATASVLVAIPQLLLTFAEATGPLPFAAQTWLVLVCGSMFTWTVLISQPVLRVGEVYNEHMAPDDLAATNQS